MPTLLNYAALDEVLSEPTGTVMRYIGATAEAIHSVAGELIHTSSDAHADGSPHLKDTGSVLVLRGHAEVKFDAPYAAAIELGARPHIIRAKNGPNLVFFWGKVGRVVAFPQVNHPGNEAQHFLTRAAAIIAAAPLA